MPNKKAVGERLRKLRGTRSRSDVADALDVTVQAIWLWESGQRMPGDSMKIKIADYYRRSVANIFYKD